MFTAATSTRLDGSCPSDLRENVMTATTATSHHGCVVNPHHDSTATCVDHHVTFDVATGREFCHVCKQLPVAAQDVTGRRCGPCLTFQTDLTEDYR